MNKQINELIAVGNHDNIFPLFSKADLARRWGRSIQSVNDLSKRRADFPKEIKEIFKTPDRTYYPLCEVERFERDYKNNNVKGFGNGSSLAIEVNED